MAEKQMTALWDTVSCGCAELEREHAHEPGHETIRRQRECRPLGVDIGEEMGLCEESVGCDPESRVAVVVLLVVGRGELALLKLRVCCHGCPRRGDHAEVVGGGGGEAGGGGGEETERRRWT